MADVAAIRAIQINRIGCENFQPSRFSNTGAMHRTNALEVNSVAQANARAEVPAGQNLDLITLPIAANAGIKRPSAIYPASSVLISENCC